MPRGTSAWINWISTGESNLSVRAREILQAEFARVVILVGTGPIVGAATRTDDDHDACLAA